MPPEGEMTEEMRRKMIDARLYASIVESSNDAIISKSLDGIIQSWNAAAQRLFGYTAQEAVGRHISMLIPADRTEEESLIIARLRAGERIEHYDTVRLRNDGQEVPVSLTISPVKDEDGRIIMASKIVRDITERRNAEVALRRSEKNLADFFDNATVCIHWVGPDGIILRANNAELELLGYSAEDYVGRHIADFHADQPVIDAILNCLTRGEKLQDYAARLVCKDGSIREVLINSSVLREDGKFLHTRCVTRDVTTQRRAEAEARESEHRMRLATEATSVGIWEWNLITDEIRWDAMMFQIYGIEPTPNGAIQYADWTQRVVAPDLGQQLAILNDTIQRIGSSKRQFRIRRGNDGELRDIECVETVRANNAGVAEWVVGTNLDVTQRKQAEEELRQSLEKVQALMDTLPVGVFVAHDPECRTITGNAAAHALLRTPNSNLSKTGPADTAPMHFRVCRNDVDIPTEDLPVQRAARGEFLRDEEVDDIFDDGTVVHTLMSASPLYDGDGRVRGAVATVLDVTERKRAEKALARIAAESERQQRLYETVLTNTPDFMYVFSLDHRVIYANEALITMWGKGRDGAIGKTFLEIGYEPWHAEMHAREIDEVRATKQPIRGQVPFDGAHGRRQYEYIFVPVIGADGEVEAVAGTTRDITDREQDEEKLRWPTWTTAKTNFWRCWRTNCATRLRQSETACS